MSVYSMTGYAIASTSTNSPPPETTASGEELLTSPKTNTLPAAQVSVELRSVNNRFLDMSFRMPDELRGLEPALRELLSTQFKRGKIELRLNTKTSNDSPLRTPQPDQLQRLSHIQSMVQSWLPTAPALSVNDIMQWSSQTTSPDKLDDIALEAAKQAITGLKEARQREGTKLSKVLMERVAKLRELAKEVEPLIPEVVQKQQQKFLDRWQDALQAASQANPSTTSVSTEAAQERALGEAAAFAIRIDVAEELARLQSHLDEVARLLKKGGEVGKRLDFLIQELLREANTVASKAASLELTNLSIEMKVAIEQMREQVQNLE